MDLGIANDLLKDGERGGELAIPVLGANAPHDRVSSLEYAVSHRIRSIRPQSGYDTFRRAHPPLGQLQVLDLLVEVDHDVSGVWDIEGDLMQFALHAIRGSEEFGGRGLVHVRSANIDNQLLAIGLGRGFRGKEPVGRSVGDLLGHGAHEAAGAGGLL